MGGSLHNHKKDLRIYLWVGIFGIAFGFLEAIVVVYLRQVYYPEGFNFPLVLASPQMFRIQLIREISTILMPASIGILSGRNAIQRFAWFLFVFAIWDVFYYVGLKFFLDWPPSLLTWDILFLIPVIWDGPVLAPVICSLTMIGFAITVVEFERRGHHVKLTILELGMMLFGALLIFITFVWDYTAILIRNDFFSGAPVTEDSIIMQEVLSFTPTVFKWYIFIVGEIFILTGIFLMIRNIFKSQGITVRAFHGYK